MFVWVENIEGEWEMHYEGKRLARLLPNWEPACEDLYITWLDALTREGLKDGSHGCVDVRLEEGQQFLERWAVEYVLPAEAPARRAMVRR